MSLQSQLEEVIADSDGRWGIYVRGFGDQKATVSINADAEFYGASLGKLPILLYLLDLLGRERRRPGTGVKWENQLLLRDEHRAEGTGILRHFPTGYHLTVRETVALMLIVSDTTAAKLLVANMDGPKEINRFMGGLGLKTTRLVVKEDGRFEFGHTTPWEMSEVLRYLCRYDRISETVLDFMRQNRFPYGLRRHFQTWPLLTMSVRDKLRRLELEVLKPIGWQRGYELIIRQVLATRPNSLLAGKEGSFEDCRDEAGILYVGNRKVLVSVCSDEHLDTSYRPNHPALVTLGQIGQIVHDHYSR